MSSKAKPLVTERGCPKCEARITFPEDVKTVLCPKCRRSFRVHRDDNKLSLSEPDRTEDLATAIAIIGSIEAEIELLLEKVTRFERLSFFVLVFTLIPFGILIWALQAAFSPNGEWDQFYIALILFLGFLLTAYWLAFNPIDNRKIMKLQEERIALRRRIEQM